MNDAFSPNRELLLDERIIGIATVPHRVTGCACGVGVPLMYVSRRTGTGLERGGNGARRTGRRLGRGGKGGGCTAHPRHLLLIIIIIFSVLPSIVHNHCLIKLLDNPIPVF